MRSRQPLLLAIAGLAIPIVGGHAEAQAPAMPASRVVEFLNAERAREGLPADLRVNPTLSAGCEAHRRYIAKNGVDWNDPHNEKRWLPGYSDAGRDAATNAVLLESYNATGFNPYYFSPLHYAGTMNPGLVETGYAPNCLWVKPTRPKPAETQLFTVPADGRTGITPMYQAGEWPFVPGDFVGLPEGTWTGPYLYILGFGQDLTGLRVTAMSLTGPDGPVEMRAVDSATPGAIHPYVGTDAYLIPSKELKPRSIYRVAVDIAQDYYDGLSVPAHREWTFKTSRKFVEIPRVPTNQLPVQPTKPRLSFQPGFGYARLTGGSRRKATFVVKQLPSGRRVASGKSDRWYQGFIPMSFAQLPAGRYRVCVTQPGGRGDYDGDPVYYATIKMCASARSKFRPTKARTASR